MQLGNDKGKSEFLAMQLLIWVLIVDDSCTFLETFAIILKLLHHLCSNEQRWEISPNLSMDTFFPQIHLV